MVEKNASKLDNWNENWKFYWEFGPRLWRDNNNHCQPGVALQLVRLMRWEALITQHSIIILALNSSTDKENNLLLVAWNDTSYNIIGIAFDADT